MKNQMEILPAGVRLQELLREAGAGEIRKKELIANIEWSFREVGILIHFAEGAGANEQSDVWNVAHADFLIEHFVVHHGGHRGTFAHRVTRKFGVVIRARGFDPGINVEGLIFKRVGQLVRHHRALLVRRNPVRDIKFLGFGVV